MLIVLASAPHRPQTPFLDLNADKEPQYRGAQTLNNSILLLAAYWE